MQWNKESKNAGTVETEPQIHNRPESPQRPRIFEYSGNGNLIIKGTVTGVSYHFHHKGAQISVDHSDAFAMMAERDLKPVFL